MELNKTVNFICEKFDEFEHDRAQKEKIIKGALSGLRQFLATECTLKMMKNAFYITSKALFVLKIFKFLS